MDKLENFMNWLTDMDWGWWPVLSWRPSKDQEMNDRILLKLTLVFGSMIGMFFLLVFLLVAARPLTFGNIVFFIVFCLFWGWILYFSAYKLTFAYFWNRRARRLRLQRQRGICVNIYELRRRGEDWVIDEKHPVAVVMVVDRKGSFQFYDKSREKVLRRLFAEPARAHSSGGRILDGAFVDAYVTYPAWTREALELIVSHILRGYSLGGTIIDYGPDAVRPS